MVVRIIVGDALTRLRSLPDESVHCCVTSPPYWGLRAYKGGDGMIGLEPTFDKHLENLVAVFREVRRVLRSDGTLWLNYGDAYANAETPGMGWRAKDLMLMPARVAIALQEDRWWLRSEVIWHKPNPMPESVTDRPTSAHEKVFLFSKSTRYFYDAEAVRVTSERLDRGKSRKAPDNTTDTGMTGDRCAGDGTANLRNVWKTATTPYKDAHFATFPPKLVEPCIKAGTSEKGVCSECGAPWVRELERSSSRKYQEAGYRDTTGGNRVPKGGAKEWAEYVRPNTIDWSPTCKCDADTVPAVVLDPFAGAGTVGLVAGKLERASVLIEISRDYATMARDRILSDAPLFNDVRMEF